MKKKLGSHLKLNNMEPIYVTYIRDKSDYSTFVTIVHNAPNLTPEEHKKLLSDEVYKDSVEYKDWYVEVTHKITEFPWVMPYKEQD